MTSWLRCPVCDGPIQRDEACPACKVAGRPPLSFFGMPVHINPDMPRDTVRFESRNPDGTLRDCVTVINVGCTEECDD